MSVYFADQQQYTSAGEKVEGAGGGINKWLRMEERDWYTNCFSKCSFVSTLSFCVHEMRALKRQKLSVFRMVFVLILTWDVHESWAVSEWLLSQLWAEEMAFCKEFMVWHIVTKCTVVIVIKIWISSHLPNQEIPAVLGIAPRKHQTCKYLGYEVKSSDVSQKIVNFFYSHQWIQWFEQMLDTSRF